MPSSGNQRSIPIAELHIYVLVEGFDTTLGEEAIKQALQKGLASCGQITDICVTLAQCHATVHFISVGAVEAAVKLSGKDIAGGELLIRRSRELLGGVAVPGGHDPAGHGAGGHGPVGHSNEVVGQMVHRPLSTKSSSSGNSDSKTQAQTQVPSKRQRQNQGREDQKD